MTVGATGPGVGSSSTGGTVGVGGGAGVGSPSASSGKGGGPSPSLALGNGLFDAATMRLIQQGLRSKSGALELMLAGLNPAGSYTQADIAAARGTPAAAAPAPAPAPAALASRPFLTWADLGQLDLQNAGVRNQIQDQFWPKAPALSQPAAAAQFAEALKGGYG